MCASAVTVRQRSISACIQVKTKCVGANVAQPGPAGHASGLWPNPIVTNPCPCFFGCSCILGVCRKAAHPCTSQIARLAR